MPPFWCRSVENVFGEAEHQRRVLPTREDMLLDLIALTGDLARPLDDAIVVVVFEKEIPQLLDTHDAPPRTVSKVCPREVVLVEVCNREGGLSAEQDPECDQLGR